MNPLIDQPPKAVTVSGQKLPISWDFRTGVRFELMMLEPDLSHEKKLCRALLLYFGGVPDHPAEALDMAFWFWRCGKDPEEGSAGLFPQHAKRSYDFDEDGERILSAFRSVYGIDLTTATMHWWTFRALFEALPTTCDFVQIMSYRTADTSGMSKSEKKRYAKMWKLYALKPKGKQGPKMTLEQRNQAMKDYVAKRFQNAGLEAGE